MTPYEAAKLAEQTDCEISATDPTRYSKAIVHLARALSSVALEVAKMQDVNLLAGRIAAWQQPSQGPRCSLDRGTRLAMLAEANRYPYPGQAGCNDLKTAALAAYVRTLLTEIAKMEAPLPPDR